MKWHTHQLLEDVAIMAVLVEKEIMLVLQEAAQLAA
jgi:transketolase C-terminal domain/subunit